MKLFWVSGPTEQVIHLLGKWEKDVKFNGLIYKILVTDKKKLLNIADVKGEHITKTNFKESF